MAAYWQASSQFPPLFVESQNYFIETDTHVSEINGIPLSRLPYSTHEGSDSFRIHNLEALRTEGERNFFVNSFAHKDSQGGVYKQSGHAGILDIFIQEASGINNICIYGEQDVYARFSILHSLDKALCSRIVKGGGKNPVFNQNLQIAVENLDSFLKCEIWMSSRVSYLDDQLLGFVSLPLCSLAGKGRHSQDYPLSTTDLCHSHAGIVKLTLMYHSEQRSPLMGTQMLQMVNGVGGDFQLEGSALGDTDMTSDISTLSFTCCQIEKLCVSDFNNVDFPSIEAICEDQQLVSDYLGMASNECERAKENGVIIGPPFLPQFHSMPLDQVRDNETNKETEKCNEASVLADDCELFNYGEMPDPSAVSCTNADISEAHKNVTTLSNAHVSLEKQMVVSSSPDRVSFPVSQSLQAVSTMAMSQEFFAGFPADNSLKEGGGSTTQKDNIEGSLNAPLLNIPSEPESSKVMQQQIVDMYMKSMQQFSDPLTRMQLSVDLDRQVKYLESSNTPGESGKKISHRVFYGSRAFF